MSSTTVAGGPPPTLICTVTLASPLLPVTVVTGTEMVDPVCSRMSEDAGPEPDGAAEDAEDPADAGPPALVALGGAAPDAPCPPQAASTTPAPTMSAATRPPGRRPASLRVMSPPRIRASDH